MNDIIRIGIVGLGFIGSHHASCVKELPQCRLSAVCDVNSKALEPYEKEGIECFSDPEEFFRSGSVDAVIIAMPHYAHVRLAVSALRHGLHVLVEKPLAVRKSEAELLVGEAQKHPGLKAGVMFCLRRIPAHIRLKQLLESGELGRVRRINWITTKHFRTQGYYDSGAWRGTWKGEGGGLLLNQCHHQLDLLQWFFGMPERVSARLLFGKYHHIEVEDEVSALLEYPVGTTGIFVASTGEAPGTNRLEIAADRGRVLLEDESLVFLRNEIPVTEYIRTGRLPMEPPPVWKIGIPATGINPAMHREVIGNFADAILYGTELFSPVEEGLRALELENAMLLSQLKNTTLSLPLDNNAFDMAFDSLLRPAKTQG
ncbi:MAG: Inositol 2-dehydrogenase [Lentisphaerae bacterium ADurb.Bin242]|nr:MAG: Inositol 2-dehydrogenase [Lentisphaerae bacterium ADurb.Bin242]